MCAKWVNVYTEVIFGNGQGTFQNISRKADTRAILFYYGQVSC